MGLALGVAPRLCLKRGACATQPTTSTTAAEDLDADIRIVPRKAQPGAPAPDGDAEPAGRDC